MILIAIALALLAAVLLLPTLSDLVSVVRALSQRPAERRAAATPPPPPSLLFLVPAHDEEQLIEGCIGALLRQRYPVERRTVVVIADNCTDRTAELARGSQVRCLERHDSDRPGKPYALEWGISQLDLAGIDAIVIVDADSVVAPDFAAALAAAAPLRGKAVQPFNGVANNRDNALTRMAAVLSTANHRFAFGVKNRAGLNVPLSNGMCLGADVLGAVPWSVFSIAEDWEMYAVLTERGIRIESVPQARVLAQEASSLRQSSSQRRRWTAGKLAVLLQRAPAILRSRRIGVRQKVDCLAELSAWGPAVHVAIVVVAVALGVLRRPPGAEWIILALALPLVRWGMYTVAALAVDPEPGDALLAFAFLPLYAVWRAGTALAALTMLGDQPWVRTERH
jgi:1,2-diacylglycerol 3-beta-glucosyltransferase